MIKKERGLIKLHREVDNEYQNYYREIQVLNVKKRKSQTKISQVLRKVDHMIEMNTPTKKVMLQPVPGSPVSRQSTRHNTPISGKKKGKVRSDSPTTRHVAKPLNTTPTTGRKKSVKIVDSPIVVTPIKKSNRFSTPASDSKKPKSKQALTPRSKKLFLSK